MKILIHTRTAGEFDWEHRLIELHHMPHAGEYIMVPKKGSGGEVERYEVRLVVHLATGGDAEAELYCNRVGPTQMKNLAWGSTTTRREPSVSSVVLLSVEQAAAAAGVSRDAIDRLCRSGRLECVDYGTGSRRHSWRISPEALRNLKPVPQPEPEPQPPPRRGRRPRAAASESVLQYLADA